MAPDELNKEMAASGKQGCASGPGTGRLPDSPGVLLISIARATMERILATRIFGKWLRLRRELVANV